MGHTSGAGAGAAVTTAISGPPGGPYLLTAHIGGATAGLTVTVGGLVS